MYKVISTLILLLLFIISTSSAQIVSIENCKNDSIYYSIDGDFEHHLCKNYICLYYTVSALYSVGMVRTIEPLNGRIANLNDQQLLDLIKTSENDTIEDWNKAVVIYMNIMDRYSSIDSTGQETDIEALYNGSDKYFYIMYKNTQTNLLPFWRREVKHQFLSTSSKLLKHRKGSFIKDQY